MGVPYRGQKLFVRKADGTLEPYDHKVHGDIYLVSENGVKRKFTGRYSEAKPLSEPERAEIGEGLDSPSRQP